MVEINQAQLYQVANEILIFSAIILLTALIALISRTLIDRAVSSTSPYLAVRIKRCVSVFIWAIGFIVAIRQVGISIDILVLLVALAGIGFIVSAYPMLQNIVSRSFFNFQFRVGDLVSIGGATGKVIEITDINTVLLDHDGNLVSIPNVLFLKEIWTKHQLSGYEVTIPFELKKEIDIVTFEKELLETIKDLKKYYKNAPHVITSSIDEKSTELSLILNLKDPEQKSYVITQINDKVQKLITEFNLRAEEAKKETKLKEIKDIGK